jgi:hypothetical protein
MDDIEGILYGQAPKVTQAQTKLTSVVESKQGGVVVDEKSSEKILGKKVLVGQASYLSIKYSSTISLGDFRMCKVEKSLFLPVGIEASAEIQQKIQATNDWGCALLEKLMEKEVTEAMAEKNKNLEKKQEEFSIG